MEKRDSANAISGAETGKQSCKKYVEAETTNKPGSEVQETLLDTKIGKQTKKKSFLHSPAG